LRLLQDRQALAVEELEATRPAERVGGDLQYPPAPARCPDGLLDVDHGDLPALGLPQLQEVDVWPLLHAGDDQDGGVAVERAIERDDDLGPIRDAPGRIRAGGPGRGR